MSVMQKTKTKTLVAVALVALAIGGTVMGIVIIRKKSHSSLSKGSIVRTVDPLNSQPTVQDATGSSQTVQPAETVEDGTNGSIACKKVSEDPRAVTQAAIRTFSPFTYSKFSNGSSYPAVVSVYDATESGNFVLLCKGTKAVKKISANVSNRAAVGGDGSQVFMANLNFRIPSDLPTGEQYALQFVNGKGEYSVYDPSSNGQFVYGHPFADDPLIAKMINANGGNLESTQGGIKAVKLDESKLHNKLFCTNRGDDKRFGGEFKHENGKDYIRGINQDGSPFTDWKAVTGSGSVGMDVSHCPAGSVCVGEPVSVSLFGDYLIVKADTGLTPGNRGCAIATQVNRHAFAN